jgi:hypothetical protein
MTGPLPNPQKRVRRQMPARRELGLKHLLGDGVPARPEIALEYLSKYADEPEIALALAECVPLEALMRHQRVELLEQTAPICPAARDKLDIWQMLCGDQGPLNPEEHRGFQLLRQLEHATIERLLDEAYQRLTHRLPHVLQIAVLTGAGLATAGSKLVEFLPVAERGDATLEPLSAQQVHDLLMATTSSPYAHHVLGRAQIGLACGRIPWERVTPKLNYRAGYAHLLRAADGGECRAWHVLYIASSDYRSVLANQGAAQFFLEKAAAQGHVASQTLLGVKTLQAARTVEDVVAGQRWLGKAWEQRDQHAGIVLRSFGVPPPATATERATATVARIQPLDPLLAALLQVARTFGLTRKEAFGLTLSSVRESNSLVFVPERRSTQFALPAIGPELSNALREFASCLVRAAPASGTAFERRRAADQRALFSTYGFEEGDFFRELHQIPSDQRDLSRWKSVNAALLREALDWDK